MTDGGTATAPPTTAVWLSPAFFVIDAAAPATEIAVKETAGSDPELTLRTFVPVTGPRVQPPTVAIPEAFVVAVAPVTVPPPLATVKVTATSGFGFPFTSLMITDGATATALPAAAVWLSPPFFASEAAGPAVDVAVKTTAGSVPEVAVTVFGPAIVPSVQDPTVATPASLLVTVAPATDPPPAVTANVTAMPGIGEPFWSFTMTEGGGVTASPTVPVTDVEELAESVVATAGSVLSPLQLTNASRTSAPASRAAFTESLFTQRRKKPSASYF
jgi:hypothetical protein